jgi:hypothetical protein
MTGLLAAVLLLLALGALVDQNWLWMLTALLGLVVLAAAVERRR